MDKLFKFEVADLLEPTAPRLSGPKNEWQQAMVCCKSLSYQYYRVSETQMAENKTLYF